MKLNIIKLLTYTVLTILLASLAFAGIIELIEPEVIEKIGDVTPIEFERNSTLVDYTEIRDRFVIGFRPVYKSESYTANVCNSSIVDLKNVTVCVNETRTRLVLDDSKKGSPIYEFKPIKAIKYDKKRYDFETKQCWICGEYIACLSNKDGGTGVQHRAEEYKCDEDNKPILRSGESGYIKRLEDDKMIKERSDVGEI